MMSQSASMDIYVLDMSGAEFATLLDRGYAVELGGSEKIASLVGQMYPAIAEGRFARWNGLRPAAGNV